MISIQATIGWIGFSASVATCVTTTITSYMADWIQGHVKDAIIVLLSVATLSFLWFGFLCMEIIPTNNCAWKHGDFLPIEVQLVPSTINVLQINYSSRWLWLSRWTMPPILCSLSWARNWLIRWAKGLWQAWWIAYGVSWGSPFCSSISSEMWVSIK